MACRMRIGLLLAWATAGSFGTAAAQDTRVTLSAGVSEFDLSGTGTAFTASARVDVPIRPVLLLEAGIGFLSADQQFGDTTTVLLPEVQAQVQYPGSLSPYLGLGLGLAADFRDEEDGGTEVDPTFSIAGGVRVAVTEELGLRAELRVRGHETGFVGTTADITGGLSWRF